MKALTPAQRKALRIIWSNRATRSFTVEETDAFEKRTAKALEKKGLIAAVVKQSDLSWNKRWVLTAAGETLGDELTTTYVGRASLPVYNTEK